MNVRLPGGSTVDAAMFFGDRGAPNPDLPSLRDASAISSFKKYFKPASFI
jgi:hypothetical protein